MTIFEASESVLIRLEGRLDASNAATLQQKLSALEPRRHTLWVLDMANVEFIDSAGLVALIAGLKAARRHGCRLAICHARPSVKLLFEITQLDGVFEIFENLADLTEPGLHMVEHLLPAPTPILSTQVAA
jgi:anti-anti-sigma factor